MVLGGVQGAVQFGPLLSIHAAHVMAGHQGFGPQIPGHAQKVTELDRLVAPDAGNGRFAGQIAVGELLDHLFPEPAFVIQHVMGNTQRIGDPLGVVNVLTGAARPFASLGGAVIIKLQGHPDDLEALFGHQRRRGRAVDAAQGMGVSPAR